MCSQRGWKWGTGSENQEARLVRSHREDKQGTKYLEYLFIYLFTLGW